MQFGVARVFAFVMALSLLAGLANHIVSRSPTGGEAAIAASSPLLETEVPWQSAMASKVRLESAQSAVGEGYVVLGLEMQLDEGWKTYWRDPGDSGLAPRFDWSGSTNLKSINMAWPAPLVFDEAGERNYGYKGTVIWPLRVTVEDAGKPLMLSLALDYGVCADVCIPVRITTQLVVPAGPSERTPAARTIQAATRQVPQTVQAARLNVAMHLQEVEGHRAQLVVEVGSTQGVPEFVPEIVILTGLQGVYFGASHPFGDGRFRVPLEADVPDALRGQQVEATFLGTGGADDSGHWAAAGHFHIQ